MNIFKRIACFFKKNLKTHHENECMKHCILALHHFQHSKDNSILIRVMDTDLCLLISKNQDFNKQLGLHD